MNPTVPNPIPCFVEAGGPLQVAAGPAWITATHRDELGTVERVVVITAATGVRDEVPIGHVMADMPAWWWRVCGIARPAFPPVVNLRNDDA